MDSMVSVPAVGENSFKREMSRRNPSAASAAEVSHAVAHFSIYMKSSIY